MEEAFPALMDADIETLLEYLERKKQPVQVSSAPEKKCVHEGIETDEKFVCSECGLVLKETLVLENGGATWVPTIDDKLAMWKYRASPSNPVNR